MALPNNPPPILFGDPFGAVYPAKAPPPPLAIDGRTAALQTLKSYVTNLFFFRSMGPGLPPHKFSVPPEHFHIEWPDSIEDLVTPSFICTSARADYDVIGLVAYLEEETRDLYSPGTVLQWQAEYVETFNLEIWASKKAERRAMLAGLETALSPTELMSGIRFVMPDYWGELVCFTLMRRELLDGPESARNRRRAQLEIQMRFNVVALVNYVDLTPVVKVNTDVDLDTNEPVVLDPHAPQNVP